VADRHEVDDQLVAVLNEVLDAVYQAKQASWSASTSPRRGELQELVSFLIEQSGQLMVAEEQIDGRSANVTSPSSHQRGNLLAEADGDLVEAIERLAKRLVAVAEDVRSRASAVPDAAEAPMLLRLADGLDVHVRRLRSS
jgi:hypothetical protein